MTAPGDGPGTGDSSPRFALVVACSRYQDATLRRLAAPARDASSLARVLQDPTIGDFETTVLTDATVSRTLVQMEEFFQARRRSDLALLYFSGHGIKSAEGNLYFAATDTQHDRLRSTAVPATFVHEVMQNSRSRTQVLILDCCHSGAFARGMVAKSGSGMQIGERFEGRGRIVLTASDAMQYAFEGDEVSGSASGSVFTRHVVDGLRTGAADLDGDGYVSVDELYDYVHERVAEQTSAQRPAMWAFGVQGDILVARNPVGADTHDREGGTVTERRPRPPPKPRPRWFPPRRRTAVTVALVALVVLAAIAAMVVVRQRAEQAFVDLKINFQSRDAPPPPGYLVDFGEAYGPRSGPHQGEGLSYGWVEPGTSTPLSLLSHARERGREDVDQLLDTLMHMAGWNPGAQRIEPGSWEIAVPNGDYYVTVSVGDRVYNSTNTVNVEGRPAITRFRGTPEQEYEENTVEVTVNDGRLTLDSTGGDNTKINYVHVLTAPDRPDSA